MSNTNDFSITLTSLGSAQVECSLILDNRGGLTTFDKAFFLQEANFYAKQKGLTVDCELPHLGSIVVVGPADRTLDLFNDLVKRSQDFGKGSQICIEDATEGGELACAQPAALHTQRPAPLIS